MARFSPYIYAWGLDNPVYNINSLTKVSQLGLKNITIGFLVSDRYEEIRSWKQQIANNPNLQVTLSLGGATGCFLDKRKSVDAQANELINLLIELNINKLDLDIEGKTLENSSKMKKWVDIIDKVNRVLNLEVSLTLPVEWDGLGDDALLAINKFEKVVDLKFITLMMMDFYTKLEPKYPNWSSKHIEVLHQVHKQLRCYKWSKIGYCPMIGENDDHTKFTVDDLVRVLDFINLKGIGVVTFWAINRDQRGKGDINLYSNCQMKNLEFTTLCLNKLG